MMNAILHNPGTPIAAFVAIAAFVFALMDVRR